jgi:hypothetical protein
MGDALLATLGRGAQVVGIKGARMLKAVLAPIGGMVLVGCAAAGVEQVPIAGTPSWSYNPDASGRLIASYAAPETAWEMSLECVPSEQILKLVFDDSEVAQDRQVDIRVAEASYKGFEELDPPDGYAVSRVAVPLRERILERYAAGAGPMVITAGGKKVTIAGAPAARRMVRDCCLHALKGASGLGRARPSQTRNRLTRSGTSHDAAGW